jgi:hypothetical protein
LIAKSAFAVLPSGLALATSGLRKPVLHISQELAAAQVVDGLLRWFDAHGSVRAVLERQLTYGKLKVGTHYNSMRVQAIALDGIFGATPREKRPALRSSPVVLPLAREFMYHYSTETVGKGKPVLSRFYSSSPASEFEQPVSQDFLSEMLRQASLEDSNLKKLTGTSASSAQGQARGGGNQGGQRGRGGYRGRGGRGRGRGRGFHNNNSYNNYNNNYNNGYHSNNQPGYYQDFSYGQPHFFNNHNNNSAHYNGAASGGQSLLGQAPAFPPHSASQQGGGGGFRGGYGNYKK